MRPQAEWVTTPADPPINALGKVSTPLSLPPDGVIAAMVSAAGICTADRYAAGRGKITIRWLQIFSDK